MLRFKSQFVPLACASTAVCVLGATVFWFGKSHVAKASPPARTWIAPNEYTFYDTKGKIPGDPDKTIAHMKNTVYPAMLTYKQRYGHWPLSGLNVSERPPLGHDMFKNPWVYGYASPREAFHALENAEGYYGDAWKGKGFEKANLVPYGMPLLRPDETHFGDPKPAGTRDVLICADMYFHNNQHHFTKHPPASVPKNLLTENHPVGFYLVMWEDGKIEKIPWEKVRYLEPGSRVCFPGQAGVNWSKTISYAERQTWWLKPEHQQELIAYNEAHGIR